jgi:hypothetical protein
MIKGNFISLTMQKGRRVHFRYYAILSIWEEEGGTAVNFEEMSGVRTVTVQETASDIMAALQTKMDECAINPAPVEADAPTSRDKPDQPIQMPVEIALDGLLRVAKMQPAPKKILLADGHFMGTLPVGKDESVTIYAHRDALDALESIVQRMTTKPEKEQQA